MTQPVMYAACRNRAWKGLVLLCLLNSIPTLSSATARITYLANEGVMVDCNGQKILIDALLRDSLDTYVRHPPDVQERLETGKAPFDQVILALATHFHLDHWDAGAISRFLVNNPHAVFGSTQEGTAMMPWSVHQRVRNLWPAAGKQSYLEVGDAQVRAFPLEHDNTQNLAYRISFCGRTLWHLGDAEASETSFQHLLATGPTDIAFVPFWWLLDDKAAAFVRNTWKPHYVIAVHFGTTDKEWATRVQASWPKAWVCTKQGEARNF